MDILKLSTGLQSGLIKTLSAQSEIQEILTQIVKETAEALKASACTVFTIDPGGRTATQQAGTGYQEQFVGKKDVQVLPANQVLENPEPDEKLGLTGWILSTGKPFLARTPEELLQHPHHSGERDAIQVPGEELRLQSFLGVPLRGFRGEVIGMIKAERRVKGGGRENGEKVEPFSVQDQLALETIALVISKCNAYLEMIQEGKEHEAITAWARGVIEEAVATEEGLDRFLEIVADVVASAMRADSCAIYLKDESGNTLTQRAGIGALAPRKLIRSYSLPEQDLIRECESVPACVPCDCPNRSDKSDEKRRVGLTAWIAATGKSFHASNFDELRIHCYHKGKYDEWNFPTEQICGAFLGIPLQVGGTIIGVLKAENISQTGVPDPRDFSREAQQRFEILAQDIALAIMRLQAQIEARYRVINDAQETIREILRGGLDVPELAEKVVSGTAELFNAKACALFLKEGNRLIQPPWAAWGWMERGPQVREYELVEKEAVKDDPAPEEKVGLTVWIAVKQRKFTARSNLELTLHPHQKGKFDEVNFEVGERCESFMGFPLLIKEKEKDKEDQLVGVLKVETKMRRVDGGEEYTYFNEQDEIVFELIANSAAIAIQNARLLESRRLADRVLAQPDANAVMRVLYEFLQGRLQVVSTLNNTAKIVRGENPHRGKIIQSFASLLEPGFYDVILEQLANLTEDHINSLLVFLIEALGAEDLDRIFELHKSSNILPMPSLLHPDCFLRECAKVFLFTLREIGVTLEEYSKAHKKRAILRQSLIPLEEARSRVEGMGLFEKSVLGRIFASWHTMITEALQRGLIPNPYITGHPVKSADMFQGREDIFQFIADNISGRGQNRTLVLHGQRRTGKTSILYQLLQGRLGDEFVPVLIDMQEMALLANSTSEFLGEFAYQLARTVRRAGIPIEEPAPDSVSTPRSFKRFLDALEDSLGDRWMVVMFDEFELIERKIAEGKLEADILDYFRNLMQHHDRLVFIFTGTHRLEEMSHDYWSVFFNIALYQRVSFLKPADAVRLIREPVANSLDVDDLAVERIINLTNGHPYFVQLLCWALVNHCNAREHNKATIDDVNEVVQDILITGEAHFAYIWTQAAGAERLALAGLAHTLREVKEWARPDEILETLAASGDTQTQRATLVEALDQLVAQEALEVAQEGALCYRFQLDVLRLWVKTNQFIPVLVERGQ
jgi:GAF domain-containing protein